MLNKLILFTRREDIRRTFGYYSMFICLGLDMAIGGPTLPALAGQTGTNLGSMGLLFLFGAGGGILGTIISGRVFDRVRGHPVLGIALLVAAGLIFSVPFIPWLWLLLLVLFLKGIAYGFVNTGANTLLTWTHGEKVGPFMSALHFFFGLGTFVAPFLVAQVIGIEGGYRWAYWAMAAFAALVGLRILTLKGSPRPIHAGESPTAQAKHAPIPYPIVIVSMLFLFFYVGAEITFGGWVYTYAITLNLAGETAAAYLTSAFWLAFTIGRLISIPLATRLTPKQIIPAAVSACLAFLVLTMVFPASATILWAAALGLGFFMAPVWPTGFTLAGQSVNLSGRVSSLILLGDSFGGMVLPTLVGKVIEGSGPRMMIYLVFGSLTLNLLAFGGMLRLRPPRPKAVAAGSFASPGDAGEAEIEPEA